MVKVKEEPMAEASASTSSSNPSSSSGFGRKPRFGGAGHVHYHPPVLHFPYHHYCYYSTPEGAPAPPSTTDPRNGPAKFYFGPGFEPHQMEGGVQGQPFGAGPSRTQQNNEHIVLFHVNPGVVISLQIGNHRDVLTGKKFFMIFYVTEDYLTRIIK